MRVVKQLIKAIVFVSALVAVPLFVHTTLPYPLSLLMVELMVGVLYVMRTSKASVVWYVAVSSYIIELLIPSSVFGARFVAITLAVLVAYWSHKYFFTNTSLYTSVFLTCIAYVMYRALWFVWHAVGLARSADTSVFSFFDAGVMFGELLTTVGFVLLGGVYLLRKATQA